MKSLRDVYNCDSITLNVSNACPLSCFYCFEHKKDAKMMDLETAKKIIDNTYRKLNGKQKFTVNLFGGEPFTNWSMIKGLIDYTESKHYDIHYAATTNLVILTDEMIQYIDDYSINLLVSIDGVKEVHDRNRSNSYDRVAENIKKLIDAGCGILIEGRITVPPTEVSHMSEGVKHVWDLGINSICPIPVTDMEWTKEDLETYRSEYRKVLQFYMEKVQVKDADRNIYIKNTDELLGNVMDNLVEDIFMCPITSDKWCVFDPEGDIYQCHQLAYDGKEKCIGNVNTGIDEDKRLTGVLTAGFNLDRCKGCKASCVCKGGCPAENLRENGSTGEPTKAYCDIKVIQVEEASTEREELMKATTLNSRFLNMVKMNTEAKHYLDTVIMTADPLDIRFDTKVRHFQEKVDSLKDANILLPSFDQYFKFKFALIFKRMTNVIEDATNNINSMMNNKESK